VASQQPEEELYYEPMEDEAIACAIELSKQEELAKWDGLDESIQLSAQQAAALEQLPPPPPAATV
jgi:hypothetical protein